jgi:aldehyde:ferredoxin oxidoreductase
MASGKYGWCGTILRVNLTDRSIGQIDTMAYADRFLGGRGIATKIYWDEVKPETKALDPENLLMFMSGPIVATGAQGASRFEVVGKSPMLLPEGFCYGNLGGYFGPFIKRAGFDGIVITGKAESPCYVWINDGKVEILDADWLWGKGTVAVGSLLKEKHGEKAHYLTTGPAGENLCRNATVNTENEGAATGGFGAVMGSKNLKAIVVAGTGRPAIADQENFRKLTRRVIEITKRPGNFNPFPEDQVKLVGKASCYQCGLDCNFRNTFEKASGGKAIRKCQAMFVYTPWVARREGESMETSIDATGICDDLSLCTMEIANVLQWLNRSYRKGFMTEQEIGLDMSTLGSAEFFEKFADMITYRQGLGDLLAEGLLRAGEKLGDEAVNLFSNEVAGVGSGASYSPREYITNGLLYALEPRQPIAMLHETSRIVGSWVSNQGRPGATQVTSDLFRKVATLFWGDENAWDLTSPDGKAKAATKILDRGYVKDSLLLCDSVWPMMVSWHTPDHIGDPTLEAQIFSAVTGIEADEDSLNLYGERIFNLQRAVLLREGWKPKEDDQPAEFNFTDPVKTVFMNPEVIVPGPDEKVICLQGNTLDRQVYDKILNEFYQLRGWDTETGLQTEDTLNKLDLSDLAGDLQEISLLKGSE